MVNLNIKYDDEGENYESIQIKGKARLPRNDEVKDYDQENGTNIYLYEYLDESGGISSGNTAILGIYVYWTLSSRADYSDRSWRVYYQGFVATVLVNNNNYSGIHPVINIKL